MRAILVFTALALVACDDGSTPGPDAAATTDAPATLDAFTVPDGPPLAVDAALGMACGGKLATRCSGDQFCDFPDDICGAADGTGTCQPRPLGCPDPIEMPVCACDGNVYSIECDAYAAGFDLNALGGCTPPADTFACGPRFCSTATQYCQVTQGGINPQPPDYSCQPIPAACPAQPGRDCTCFAGELCAMLCSESAEGNFTLMCQFP